MLERIGSQSARRFAAALGDLLQQELGEQPDCHPADTIQKGDAVLHLAPA
jgi:hypothetical protein